MPITFRETIESDFAMRFSKWHWVMSPATWISIPTPINLTWKSVTFNEANKGRIPKKPGIYAFVLVPDLSNSPQGNYLMYVGRGGHIRSNGTIRDRYDHYLGIQTACRARPALKTTSSRKDTADHFAQNRFEGAAASNLAVAY